MAIVQMFFVNIYVIEFAKKKKHLKIKPFEFALEYVEAEFLFEEEIPKQIHYSTRLLTPATFACKGFAFIPALLLLCFHALMKGCVVGWLLSSSRPSSR